MKARLAAGLNARLKATLEALGAPGVLALGVLAFCAGFHVLAVRPAEDALEARQRLQAQSAPRMGLHAIAAEPRARRLERFYALFPPPAELATHVERVHRLAAASSLQVVQGDYRLEPVAHGLGGLHISLPVRGDYAAMRAFVGLVLKELPIVSIDGLRFERKNAADAQLDAQVQLTLYFRPAP